MVDTPERRVPVAFWLVSVGLLVWGLGGASIYVAYFVETPAEFAAAVMSDVHVGTEVLFVALGAFAVWFAHWGVSRGLLT